MIERVDFEAICRGIGGKYRETLDGTPYCVGDDGSSVILRDDHVVMENMLEGTRMTADRRNLFVEGSKMKIKDAEGWNRGDYYDMSEVHFDGEDVVVWEGMVARPPGHHVRP